jgi:hypothetical protein
MNSASMACGLAMGCAVSLLAASASAELAPRSPSEIITMARPAVGHGYWWGHGCWTEDGTNIGKCISSSSYQGTYGSDCSGFVAKVWQVPSPSPVELDNHPYTTAVFVAAGHEWDLLPTDRSDVRRGDAFVYRQGDHGHIVLVDQHVGGDQYWIYHASACLRGIRHEVSTVDSKFHPIRRKALVADDCTPEKCNNHGSCGDDGSCYCEAGYDGDYCELCQPGYTGYPACSISSQCVLNGELTCGASLDLPIPATGSISDYGGSCGVTGLAGGELVFGFSQSAVGKAKVSVTSGQDVSVQLIRDECDPDGCVASAKNELSFPYGAGDRFFVALDTAAGTTSAKVKVECTTDPKSWIGSPCASDEDCAFSRVYGNTPVQGYCYQHGSASFCSFPCTSSRGCPEIPNHAPTFCTADPDEASKGMCVARADTLNHNCADVTGTSAASAKRFKASATAQVCLPASDECSGTMQGQVVDATTGAGIPAATIAATGGAAPPTVTVGESGNFGAAAAECGEWYLNVQADGYLPANVAVEVTVHGVDVGQVRLQPVVADCSSGDGAVAGHVIDGVTGEPLAALVEVHEGANDPAGHVVDSHSTEADGVFEFTVLPAGYYTLTAQALDTGYSSGTQKTVAVCGNSQSLDLYLVQTNSGQLRFVLTWDRPDDLDLHLLTPQGLDVFFDEACRGNVEAPPFAQLDVDHQKADGPETITVSRFLPGRYELFVHNYSQQRDGVNVTLPDSGAEVVVYDEASKVLGRYSVPTSGSGFFWDVLTFDGNEQPVKLKPTRALESSRPNPYDEYAGTCNPT